MLTWDLQSRGPGLATASMLPRSSTLSALRLFPTASLQGLHGTILEPLFISFNSLANISTLALALVINQQCEATSALVPKAARTATMDLLAAGVLAINLVLEVFKLVPGMFSSELTAVLPCCLKLKSAMLLTVHHPVLVNLSPEITRPTVEQKRSS